MLIEVNEIDNCQKIGRNFDIDTLCCPNIKNNKITHLVDYEKYVIKYIYISILILGLQSKNIYEKKMFQDLNTLSQSVSTSVRKCKKNEPWHS